MEKNSDKLLELNPKRKRLEGAGAKIFNDQLESHLSEWIRKSREDRLRVSRKTIQREAQAWSMKQRLSNFTASNGWLTRFLQRNKFSLRRRTTVSQHVPEDCSEKVVAFLKHTWKTIDENEITPSEIYCMDETPIWLESAGNYTVDSIGKKDVPIKFCGFEKFKLTVILMTAKADGTKLPPYIVIPRKRPIKELDDLKEGCYCLCQKSFMDNRLTEDYLHRVIGRFNFSKRLMVWDSFRAHLSVSTKQILRSMNTLTSVIPGGCTGLIQPADVSWNRSLKAKVSENYDQWISKNDGHTFTRGGRMKPPSFHELSLWIKQAWKEISSNQITHSMKICGITVNRDGSEDGEIECFKKEHPCHHAKSLLREPELHNVELQNVIEESGDESVGSADDDSYCDSDESN